MYNPAPLYKLLVTVVSSEADTYLHIFKVLLQKVQKQTLTFTDLRSFSTESRDFCLLAAE